MFFCLFALVGFKPNVSLLEIRDIFSRGLNQMEATRL